MGEKKRKWQPEAQRTDSHKKTKGFLLHGTPGAAGEEIHQAPQSNYGGKSLKKKKKTLVGGRGAWGAAFGDC